MIHVPLTPVKQMKGLLVTDLMKKTKAKGHQGHKKLITGGRTSQSWGTTSGTSLEGCDPGL